MHPELPDEPRDTVDEGAGPEAVQTLGAGVRLSADPDPDPDLDVTPTREPGLGEPAEDPDPPTPE